MLLSLHLHANRRKSYSAADGAPANPA